MHSLPGTYTLILTSEICKSVEIGKLGTLLIEPGFYAYVGSAFGPGGLKARLKHHIRHPARPHWHIDYLSPFLKIKEIWHTNDRIRREHHWAEIHSRTRGALLPQPGFGASDCRCRAHFFYYRTKPSGRHFRRKIRAAYDDHARFMIGDSDIFY
jgi:Uri superfamily endonuclease